MRNRNDSSCPHSESCFTCPLPDCRGSDWKVSTYNKLATDPSSERRNRYEERSGHGNISPTAAKAARKPKAGTLNARYVGADGIKHQRVKTV